jgi:hypothetical protein
MRIDRSAWAGSLATALARVAMAACLGAAVASCSRGKLKRMMEPATGLLEGRVRLAEGLPLPSYLPIDLARRPLHAPEARAVPGECAQALEAARTPVTLGDGRSLANVVVAASDFAHAREQVQTVHKLEVRGCRLDPPMIAATAGDVLWLENQDSFAFQPLFGPTMAEPLQQGQRRRLLLGPGVDSVLCSSNAPCGRSDLVVFHHPVHAVTNSRGGFRMDHFPAGELVRVTAWHPLFEESETFVWLEPGQSSRVEIVLYPKRRFLPSLPAPTDKAAR